MENNNQTREKLGSRLGFILLSAGCAIGLGNVWRFPYVTGVYGGATFVLIYIASLIIFGIPIMTMEFGVGRGSQQSVAKSFHVLESKGTKWHIFSWFAMAGNYLLMMFYTTITGWILSYLIKTAKGDFMGVTPEGVGEQFGAMVSSPGTNVLFMFLVCLIGMAVCLGGVQKGVERITKIMMLALLGIMALLAVRSITLPGAAKGLEFYLKPSMEGIRQHGLWTVIYNAMSQSFFTLSLGVGSMAIFGSYIKKDRRLFGEALNVTVLDTFVAITAGLIIFPACAAYGVDAGAGPTLLFITLPNIFAGMPGGQIWGTLFFIFMLFAAMSTVVAVFENIVAFGMDLGGWSRKKAVLINVIALPLLSLPCALGFNVWSGFEPFGPGSGVLDLEDFILSNNLLPLGSMVYLFFCLYKKGWGWDSFVAEANSGEGLKFPVKFKVYLKYILPLIVLAIFIMGYIQFFAG
ncbi:MAG: sodium-dependent transporter [Treponema sp.]|jgi:NSS family neurotransmitter:Na+ symporter|nr:sodium-dependent transporter [Treponema sp.]